MSNSTPSYLPRKIMKAYTHTHIQREIHSSQQLYSQWPKTSNGPGIPQQVNDKVIVASPQDGILLSNTKEQT